MEPSHCEASIFEDSHPQKELSDAMTLDAGGVAETLSWNRREPQHWRDTRDAHATVCDAFGVVHRCWCRLRNNYSLGS